MIFMRAVVPLVDGGRIDKRAAYLLASAQEIICPYFVAEEPERSFRSHLRAVIAVKKIFSSFMHPHCSAMAHLRGVTRPSRHALQLPAEPSSIRLRRPASMAAEVCSPFRRSVDNAFYPDARSASGSISAPQAYLSLRLMCRQLIALSGQISGELTPPVRQRRVSIAQSSHLRPSASELEMPEQRNALRRLRHCVIRAAWPSGNRRENVRYRDRIHENTFESTLPLTERIRLRCVSVRTCASLPRLNSIRR